MSTAHTPGFPALVGGRTCLDFANTVGPRRPGPGESSRDYVPDYRQLTRWAVHAGLSTTRHGAELSAAAAEDPARAAAVMADARRLREAVYEAFAAVADGDRVPPAALDTIQQVYLAALGHGHLGPVPGGLGWRWPEQGPLEQVMWPIARSAVDLALSDQLARIKRCPGDNGHCGWLFLDLSKSATRRWCSMRTCGSRVKSRRQAARLRAANAPGSRDGAEG